MKSKKISAGEILWIVVAAGALMTGFHKIYYFGIENSYWFFIFAAIAVAMFFIRRKLRKIASEE